MGQPLSSALRQEIIKTRQEEQLSYRALADRYKVHYHTVRNLCLAYAARGDAALVADYSACGRPISPEREKVYRLVRLMRHHHPGWGVPYLLTRIEVAYPELELQHERTYQRRLKKDCPSSDLPAPTIPREPIVNDVRQAHEEWQIDAKEQLKLIDGRPYSYFNITDKCSHALLRTKPFPPPGD